MPPASPAEIASLIDQLVVGVHRAVFAGRRKEVARQLDPLGLISPGRLLDLAEFYLAAPTARDVVVSRFRYDPRDEIDAIVDDWIRARALTPGGEVSPALRDVFETLLGFRAEIAELFWHESTHIDMVLHESTMALDHATGQLTTPFKLLPLPDRRAHRLHHVLTGLRYVRMDVHVLAWQAQGLSAAQMVQLPPGSQRDEIEADTNQRYQLMLKPISSLDAWHTALVDLVALQSCADISDWSE